jgi:hypothetical protein
MNSNSYNIPLRLLRKAYQVLGISREQIYRQSPPGTILPAAEANQRIAAALHSAKPCMISRFGTPESLGILNYLDLLETRSSSSLRRMHACFQGRWDKWEEKIKRLLQDNVGFFPTTDESLERFAPFYMSKIAEMDMIGVWGFVPGEGFLINKCCPNAQGFEPSALEPYFFEDPWSAALQGRKVLVIHPFAESIEAQYRRRQMLFRNPRILPEFTLLTLRAVQTLAGTKSPFENWFEALAWMNSEVSRMDFDVAIIGAGSYGLPLCAHVKSLGKVAIHMGGATQILFGVRGKRWDNMEAFAGMFNEHWTRPLPSEMISSAHKIEGGCYW